MKCRFNTSWKINEIFYEEEKFKYSYWKFLRRPSTNNIMSECIIVAQRYFTSIPLLYFLNTNEHLHKLP